MSDTEDTSSEPSRAARRFKSALDNMAECAIEWTIRICGWSAIFFVLAIFFFVFRTAFPVLIGACASARVVVTGPNNDLVFKVRRRGPDLNGTKLIFAPDDDARVTFAHDGEAK